MLHNNILETSEEIRFSVNIKDKKQWHNAFEKTIGLRAPMPLDEGTMVVHIGSNPLLFKHGHFGTKLGQKLDQTPFSDLQLQNLANFFDVNDLLKFAIS